MSLISSLYSLLRLQQPNPNDFDIGDVWTNPNEGGTVGFINVDAIPSGCRNFIDPFIDSVTSILVQGGLTCTFFLYIGASILIMSLIQTDQTNYSHSDASCRGSSVTVQNGILAPELTGTNFDNNLSSFECSAL